MPIYEYKCTDCGKEFEVIQKFSDDPLDECIHCSGSVEKKISLSSFHLKGTGWYKTDYADKGKAKAKGKPCEVAASSADSSGGGGKESPGASPPAGCGGCPEASS